MISTPCQHLGDPDTGRCFLCGAPVEATPTLRELSPVQALAAARIVVGQSTAALIHLSMPRPTRDWVGRAVQGTGKLVTLMEPLALSGDALKSRVAFRAAHQFLRTIEERWEHTSAEGHRQGLGWAVKALTDAKRYARRWENAAELETGRALARRRAAGAE
jgi:hypothetical protein